MCGISGIISLNNGLINSHQLILMHTALKHRGPDFENIWINELSTVGFGHQRLSIIDISKKAHQPMHKFGFTITYNGELYNYKTLKVNLQSQGYEFTTESDTEVILAMYNEYRENMLPMLEGMFAFAIYNYTDKSIFLARDVYGEKPLYYLQENNQFYFASEIKALLKISKTSSVNYIQLYNYLSQQSISNPHNLSSTFYNNIYQFLPSQYCLINLSTNKLSFKSYSTNNDIVRGDTNILLQINALTTKSIIDKALTAEVKVGSSLSGGLDSSIIASVLNNCSLQYPLETVSAIFPDYSKNEFPFIDLISKQNNFICHFTSPNSQELADIIQQVFYFQDEPVANTSVLIQHQVMKLANKKNIKVLLDGQGADEIFGGYHHYLPTVTNDYKKMNNACYKQFIIDVQRNTFEPNKFQQIGLSQQIKLINNNVANILAKAKFAYTNYKINYLDNSFYNEFKTKSYTKQYYFANLNEQLNYDTNNGPLQELLRYADRNSMANAVEVRLPYLNSQLIALAKTINSADKWKDGYSKYYLRKSFENQVPKEIIYRKGKVAYEGPEVEWFLSIGFQKILKESINYLQKEKIISTSIKVNKLNNNLKWRIIQSAQLFKHYKSFN